MRLTFLIIMLTFVSSTFAQNNNYAPTQMKKILQQVSIKAIELGDYNSELTKNQLDSLWIGYEPATEKEIDSLEKRLGIKLPKDYKDFIEITNGFFAASSVEPSFCSIEKVDYLKNVDPELYEIWISTGNVEVGNKLKTAIKVGGFDEEQYFFLIPPSKENPNWEYWVFASWAPGETIYQSLIEYFDNVLETTIMFCDKRKNTHNTK